ncbi:hypothetical protein FAEPRAM212_02292 [Faecalibacterium prausnitzii M21/2]|uniref:Uncharacterized protein n=1 Tax=Faecalibacterium prausnitzii M21/2 TaxID=411485 RepID=A8SDQ3_9FIRM|nr:hypothetical protein FAEPRAM212_02292 [Faecalibacterium prausnitzii M21/2]
MFCAMFLVQKWLFSAFPAVCTIPRVKFWQFFSCIHRRFPVY